MSTRTTWKKAAAAAATAAAAGAGSSEHEQRAAGTRSCQEAAAVGSRGQLAAGRSRRRQHVACWSPSPKPMFFRAHFPEFLASGRVPIFDGSKQQ